MTVIARCGVRPERLIPTAASINDQENKKKVYMKDRFSYIVKDFFNAYGDDEFPIMLGSSGKRVEQLKEALRVLGETIDKDEDDFGSQTKKALTRLEYPTVIMDEKKFNEIILHAYNYGGKKSGKIVLTEPEMKALWMQEVSPERRDKVTFEAWLKRQGLKSKINEGGKKVFDVLFGWLQMRARGAGNTSGLPSGQQPVDTSSSGWFNKTADGSIPDGYKIIGGAAILGLGIWGVSSLIKKSREQKIVYVQN